MKDTLINLLSLIFYDKPELSRDEISKKERLGNVTTRPKLQADREAKAVYPCRPLPNVREFKIKLLSE
jgi:hypothetical protein